jgi:hypothetical protein
MIWGGFLILNIVSKSNGRRSNAINYVTGIVWIGENELLYTVSPIYGIPGVFIFDCRQMKTKKILGSKTINKAYPYGADYFKLKDFSQGKIYLYYAPDVEKANFYEFETKKYLYQVKLDGTGFKKVVDY